MANALDNYEPTRTQVAWNWLGYAWRHGGTAESYVLANAEQAARFDEPRRGQIFDETRAVIAEIKRLRAEGDA